MNFEEGIFSLFVLCCAAVILTELIVGCLLLFRHKRALPWFAGHIAAISGAMIVLIRMLFAKRLNIFIPAALESETNSLMLACFGLLWFVSTAFLLATVFTARKNPS